MESFSSNLRTIVANMQQTNCLASKTNSEEVIKLGGVLIYIDNSNVWINTMEASAKTLKFRSDIKQDQRTRVDIKKLINTASNGRPIIRAVLYGSEPPPVGKFWNNVKESRFCEVEVQVTKRSTYNHREKEVDQQIMLDIGEDIVIHQYHAKHGGTMIIFTGDGGMISAVRRALDYNWNVEVWAYRNSLAKANLEKDKLKVKYLDDYFDDVVFHTLEWRLQIPKERSFIFTLEKVHEEEKNEILEWFVKAVTGLTRMPMAGKWIRDKQGDRSPSSHLVIVCSVGKLTLKEDSRTDFVKNETCRDHNPHLKRNTFHFSRDQWNKLPNILFVEKERLYPQVRVELESFIEEAINLNANVLDNPKYDFNTDVYQKVEENLLRFGRNGTTCLPEAEVEIITFAELIFRYKPLLRSVPQFLQDMRLDDLPYEYAHKSTSAVEDDGEGGFTVESGRKIKKKFQKYSKECKYSFRCVKGFRCIYNHSDKEKEFFKVQKEPLLRKTYKFKDCDLYRNQSCKFKMNFSYMCPFAHGSYCTFCKCDTDGGHDLNQCPAPHQLENMQFFTHS